MSDPSAATPTAPAALSGAAGAPAGGKTPRWLREISARLGPPVVDQLGTMQRWLWRDGEIGVVIDKLTKVWQVVVFTPERSVTLRAAVKPTERQIRTAVGLADPTEAAVVALMNKLRATEDLAPPFSNNRETS